MGNGAADILRLVGDLHEGVSDPESWTRALTDMSGVLGQPAVMTGSIDRTGPSLSLKLEALGVPDVAVQMMAGPIGNAVDNPYLACLAQLPLRAPFGHDHVGGQQVIESSRLWRDVMQPFGVPWSMGAILDRLPERTDFAMLGKTAQQGLFEEDEKKLFALLIPHLARAYRVRRELNEMKALAADCMTALDHVGRGVVLAAEDGTVHFVNRRAEALFADGDGLSATRRGLKTGRPRADGALLGLVNEAARTGQGRASVAVGAMTVSRKSGKAPYTVIAEPLASSHRDRLGAPDRAGAILFIGGGEHDRAPAPERLATIYGLTAAEAQVAASASQGLGATEIAAVRGVSVNTVKSHLKAIFLKADVDRLPRLVARIAADVGGIA